MIQYIKHLEHCLIHSKYLVSAVYILPGAKLVYSVGLISISYIDTGACLFNTIDLYY